VIIREAFRYRITVAWVAGMLSGGFHLISVYMKDSVGVAGENLEILQELSCVIKTLRGPWVAGGDWNVDPDALIRSKWPELVHGCVVAPSSPACFSSTYDFFVVDASLSTAVAGVARVEDAGTFPHYPVRLYMVSDARRCQTRQLVRPDRVPGVLPHGPLPCPADTRALWPSTVDGEHIDEVAARWMEAARGEWSSLLGTEAQAVAPHFVWRPAVGPKAQAQAGACAKSVFWRVAARRLDECAVFIARSDPDRVTRVAVLLDKIIVASLHCGFDSDEEPGVRAWVFAAADLVTHDDPVAVKRHAALAARSAHRIECRNRDQRLAGWKQALTLPDASGSGSRGVPSRLAYQWIRGPAGWCKSPVGTHAENAACLQEQDEVDDAPAHLLVAPDDGRTSWTCKGHATPEPLSDQADVEAEGSFWGSLWQTGQEYDVDIDPVGTEALTPLLPWALRASAASFPYNTGVGAENVAPRAFARLSDELVRALCALLMAVELLGRWPAMTHFVLIALLPKSDGGRRPIGLFPAIVRVWARARRAAARAWESLHAKPYVFGAAGMGAQRAAWQCAFRAENAMLTDQRFAQSLLDLVKAFEKVPHWALVAAARKHGYNLWLVRLSLASYRLPRVVGVDGAYSKMLQATRGITAGSVFATTELRLLLTDALDHTLSIWACVDISIYVDDATIEHVGQGDTSAIAVAGATDAFVEFAEKELQLEVSVVKSVATGGTAAIAHLTARISRTKKLTAKTSAKLLGTPAGGKTQVREAAEGQADDCEEARRPRPPPGEDESEGPYPDDGQGGVHAGTDVRVGRHGHCRCAASHLSRRDRCRCGPGSWGQVPGLRAHALGRGRWYYGSLLRRACAAHQAMGACLVVRLAASWASSTRLPASGWQTTSGAALGVGPCYWPGLRVGGVNLAIGLDHLLPVLFSRRHGGVARLVSGFAGGGCGCGEGLHQALAVLEGCGWDHGDRA